MRKDFYKMDMNELIADYNHLAYEMKTMRYSAYTKCLPALNAMYRAIKARGGNVRTNTNNTVTTHNVAPATTKRYFVVVG